MTGLRHIDWEELEQFSLGTLPKTRLAPVEEHLLLCERCRRQLESTDGYVAAIREAGTRIRTREKGGAKPQLVMARSSGHNDCSH